MVNYTWIEDDVSPSIPIKQVYGIVFSDDNKILLRVEDNKYKLTGGKPEKNETFQETLKREYLEELNVEIDEIFYLGYLLVKEKNISEYAQVRMIAKVKKINEQRPDIDNGKIYGREFVDVNDVKKYLNYSDKAGNLMLDSAIEKASKLYKIISV